MKTKPTGQSILEYALIIAVAVAAMGLMGVYINRSVRANFKMIADRVNPAPSQIPDDGGDLPSCGDGICDAGEDNLMCPADCFCGDGVCAPSEMSGEEIACGEDCDPLE